jgi:hypothetical protein
VYRRRATSARSVRGEAQHHAGTLGSPLGGSDASEGARAG